MDRDPLWRKVLNWVSSHLVAWFERVTGRSQWRKP